MLLTERLNIDSMKEFGNFRFIDTPLDGVVIIEPKKYGDNRGYFMETYKESDFYKAGLNYRFIQDNQSMSRKGVLRGLHYQKTHPQTKLVRCIEGEVFDVCVDLRRDSSTFGKWYGAVLSSEKGNQMLIPKGFAHGFLVLSEKAIFCYKVDEKYMPEDECGIVWNDKDVGVEWPVNDVELVIKERDQNLPFLKDLFHE